jgi:D-glycero-alpha-D-manno-heptose 1-phosphate guanylyltransferase
MIKEAIILAGGLGTRLREAVPDLPKCMAPILAKPFIGYLVAYLQQQGIQKFIFSLGYKFNLVEQYLNTQYANLDMKFSVEEEPLGTGGAIRLATTLVTDKTVLVLNGDSFFKVSIPRLDLFHEASGADCTLALKPMHRFNRYGAVVVNKHNVIESFKEKQFYESGLINGGVYALNAEVFSQLAFPGKFSFEKDYLEQYAGSGHFYGMVQDDYFIDIGIPEDFERAQTELILNTVPNV